MRIAIDIMGGDFAPEAPIHGAVLASKELPEEVQLVLIGDQKTIEDGLKKHGANPADFDIVVYCCCMLMRTSLDDGMNYCLW